MRFLSRAVFIILTISAAATLSACGSPTQVVYKINTSPQLNPDANNRASPVVLRIYELQSPGQFESAEFFTLFNNESAALGQSLVARKEMQLWPNESKEITEKLQPATRVVGILAAFRNLSTNKWRSIVPVREGKTTRIDVVLGSTSLTVKADK